MTAVDALPGASHPATGVLERFATRAIFLAVGIAMSCWAPLVPFAKARVGVDDGALGVILLCLGLGSIAAMPFTGPLANRFGCRTVIAIASIILALDLPLLAFAPTAPLLGLSVVIFGASIGTVDVAMNIQAVIVEKDSGKSLMSGFHGLFSLGGILGSGGVSLLLSAGLSPLACTFAVAAGVLLVLVVAYRGFLPYGNRDAEQGPLFVLPRGSVILIGALCFLCFMTEGAILDWSAVFLKTARAVDPGQAGLGYTVFAVAMTIGRLSGDAVVHRLGGRMIVYVGGLLGAAGFALAVLAPSVPLSLFGFLLVGLGVSNIVPVLFTAAGRQTQMPAGLAVTAISTIGYAGILLGPALIGFVAVHLGLATSLLMLSVGLLIIAASARRVTRS